MSKPGQGFLTTMPLHKQLQSEPQALRSTGKPCICSVGQELLVAPQIQMICWNACCLTQNKCRTIIRLLYWYCGWVGGTKFLTNEMKGGWEKHIWSLIFPKNMLTFTELLRTLTFTKLFQISLPIQHPSQLRLLKFFPSCSLKQNAGAIQNAAQLTWLLGHHSCTCIQEQKEPLMGSSEKERPTLSSGPRNTG